ncbi:sugar transferase [Furfurilactobacillus curtus]|uniref:Capsular polysaccharide biosynthesis protein n=1 Tax=Furfurilactobacillus curtus TaxID=1746200 RepID=A0ABQ5JN58_9LACO
MEKQNLSQVVEFDLMPAAWSWYLPIKRLLDLMFVLPLFILGLPIVLIAALAVKLDSAGPAFFKQERLGLQGRPLTILKLRTMCQDAEKNGAQWAEKKDSRVTNVGRFLRKTRIDELPQLLSVLSGQMSLIGPRPERPEFTREFAQTYPGFEQRLRVKPGLSGYAQVHGGYDLNPAEKAALDKYYIDHLSLRMDGHIFLATLKTVITGEGSR